MKRPPCIVLTALGVLAAPAAAQTVVHHVYPPNFAPGVLFGACTDAIGDVDLDGTIDVVIGCPNAGVGNPAAGAVVVVSGASGELLHQSFGAAAFAAHGQSVSRLGDIDGDGVPDFATGRLDPSPPGPRGAIDFRSGVDGSVFFSRVGVQNLDFNPPVIDDVGDVDGDGIPDLVVGSEFEGGSSRGAVHVLSGLEGSTIHTYSGSLGAHLGTAVAGVGDVDLDGVPDFAFSSRPSNTGFVAVHSGATGAQLYNAQGSSTFGVALAGAGDVNLDGVPDLVVGDDQNGAGPGRVHLFSGATHQMLYTVHGLCTAGLSNGDRFGASVAGVGDVDLDGRPDFAAGSARYSYAQVLSGLDGSLVHELHPPDSNQLTDTNTFVAGAGDVDGDGRPDVLVGSPRDESQGVFAMGRVTLYRSGAFDVGARLGFGDGSGAACPCGNTGPTGAGCLNSAGTGARLFAGGSVSVADDDLWFRADGIPSGKSTLLFTGTAAHAGGLGIPVGDGLLVCAGTTKRLSIKTACAEGRAWWGGGMIDANLWPAGQTRYFQAWYRDPAGPCASTINFSSAVQVTLTP